MNAAVARSIGRFLLGDICNFGETSLPFEYSSGRTYDKVKSKTIWGKETRNVWYKQHVSLVFCIFAYGFNQGPLMIIFQGKNQTYVKEVSS